MSYNIKNCFDYISSIFRLDPENLPSPLPKASMYQPTDRIFYDEKPNMKGVHNILQLSQIANKCKVV
jgi:hypothetical protein